MNETALKTAVAHHRLSVPNDPRVEAELEIYYRGLMENSIFSPLVSLMEATPAVMESRDYAKESVNLKNR